MSAAPSVVFCADDFTGACDTLATLVRSGIAAQLYLHESSVAKGESNDGPSAVGLAAPLRSLAREQAVERMRRIAPKLVATGASIYHLKVCSTFDSSQQIGNMAAVADELSRHVGTSWTAIIGGQPSLGRYCLFGNLFADTGDEVFRIDRHPVMRSHPITPMREADLRRHLDSQGWAGVGLVPFTAYADGADRLASSIEQRQAMGEKQTLFDVSCADDLRVLGAALHQIAEKQRLVCVGASSVVEALFAQERTTAAIRASDLASVTFDGPVFAFAGSRSPVTAMQVRHASGYTIKPVAPGVLSCEAARGELIGTCRNLLADGVNVLAYLTDESAAGCGGAMLARISAEFVQAVVENSRVGCLAIAGGDTASAVVGHLDIDSLSVLADFDRGAALMCAHAEGCLDYLPIILKGGQMGSPDFFGRLRAAVST